MGPSPHPRLFILLSLRGLLTWRPCVLSPLCPPPSYVPGWLWIHYTNFSVQGTFQAVSATAGHLMYQRITRTGEKSRRTRRWHAISPEMSPPSPTHPPPLPLEREVDCFVTQGSSRLLRQALLRWLSELLAMEQRQGNALWGILLLVTPAAIMLGLKMLAFAI